jgi:hypothetical protein
MRKFAISAMLLLATAAVAQPDRSPPPAQPAEAPAARRAPLANVADLEPAVDVGGPRVAAASQARPAASPQPPPAVQTAPRQSTPPRVVDTLDLGTTSITGNQELPKVLYIVPWKKSDLGDLVGRPVNTLLDEVLAPVDPEVFERHLNYYETLHGESQ